MIEMFEGQQANIEVGDWVAVQLGYKPGDMAPCVALGFIREGKAIGGAVVNQLTYYEHGATGVASIASTDPRWANRKTLRRMFEICFVDLRLTRLMTWCPADRKDLIAFNRKLGMTFEGIGRRAHDGVRDAAAWSMLPEECRWLHGRQSPFAARSASNGGRAGEIQQGSDVRFGGDQPGAERIAVRVGDVERGDRGAGPDADDYASSGGTAGP